MDMNPDLIAIARILRPRGNKGELAAIPLSANPERVDHVFVNGAEYEIENVWRHGDRIVFKFRGIDSISAAEPFSGADVSIPREQRAELPQGEYYQTDLIGCSVVTRDGEVLGVLEAWQDYGGPPLLQVKSGDRELLIPFAKSICIEIDVMNRKIIVDLPEGLKDL